MSLVHLGRDMGRRLGITRETREELSDIIYDTAVVSKEYRAGYDPMENLPLGFSEPSIFMDTHGFWMMQHRYNYIPEAYFVTFAGTKAAVKVNDFEVYSRFDKGDIVALEYKELFSVVSDYTPDNLRVKEQVSRTFLKYVFHGAKKLKL